MEDNFNPNMIVIKGSPRLVKQFLNEHGYNENYDYEEVSDGEFAVYLD